MPKHNWELIKSEYVEGVVNEGSTAVEWPTLRALSEKHSVSESTMRKRSMSDDWASAKNLYRAKLEQSRREKKTELLASKSAEFDYDIFKVTENAIRHIQGHFLKHKQRLIDSQGLDPMPVSQLNELGFALERYQRIGRLILGETTSNTGKSGGDGDEFIADLLKIPEVARRIRDDFKAEFEEKTEGSVSE